MKDEKTTLNQNSDSLGERQHPEIIPEQDGMSANTARITIDRRLRKKLMESYDLIGIENKGRYYAARVESKDGAWQLELLVDKQTGNIQEVSRKHMRQDP